MKKMIFLFSLFLSVQVFSFESEIRCNSRTDGYFALYLYKYFSTNNWDGEIEYLDSNNKFVHRALWSVTPEPWSPIGHTQFWGNGLRLDINHWIHGNRPWNLFDYPSTVTYPGLDALDDIECMFWR